MWIQVNDHCLPMCGHTWKCAVVVCFGSETRIQIYFAVLFICLFSGVKQKLMGGQYYPLLNLRMCDCTLNVLLGQEGWCVIPKSTPPQMSNLSFPLSKGNWCRTGSDSIVHHWANRDKRLASENPKRFSALPPLPLQTFPRRRLLGVHRWQLTHTPLIRLQPCNCWANCSFFKLLAVFIYSMPGYACSIRDRMLYSSCKSNLVDMVESALKIPIEKKVRNNLLWRNPVASSAFLKMFKFMTHWAQIKSFLLFCDNL